MSDVATRPAAVLTLEHIPIDRIRPGTNVRREVGDVAGLAELVRQSGVVQPIRVTPLDGTDEYQLVFGARRLAAAHLAGLTTVPALVGAPPERRTVMQLHENSGRAPLTAIEEAQALQEELELGADHDELARSVGYRPEQMSDRVALLRLPASVRTRLEDGSLSLAEGLLLTRLADAPEYLERALHEADGWTTIAQAVDRQLRAKAHDDKLAAVHGALEAKGIRVIEAPHGFLPLGSHARLLGTGDGDVPVKARAHAKQSCHAAFVRNHDATVVYVCTDPAKHGVVTTAAPKDSETPETRAQSARDKRSATIARNRTLRAEHAQRRQDVRIALDAGVAPAAAAEYVLRTAIADVDPRSAEAACELIGVTTEAKRTTVDRFARALRMLASEGSKQLHRVALAITLAKAEANVCWGPSPEYGPRTPHEERVAEYFAFAAAQGHTLSVTERKLAIRYGAMAPETTPKASRRRGRARTETGPEPTPETGVTETDASASTDDAGEAAA